MILILKNKNVFLLIFLLLISCNKKKENNVSALNSTDSLMIDSLVLRKRNLTIDTLLDKEISKYLKINICTDKLFNLGETSPFFRNKDGIVLTITNISTKPIYILTYTFGSNFLLQKNNKEYIISSLYQTNTISRFKVRLEPNSKIEHNYGINFNSDINNTEIHTIDELVDTSNIDSIEIGYHIVAVDELYDASIHNQDIQEEHIKWVGNLWYSGKLKKCK